MLVDLVLKRYLSVVNVLLLDVLRS